MTSNVLNERSVVLRLEYSIADAVRHRGLFAVIGAAVAAWWAQGAQSSPPQIPASLRADVGLPDAEDPLIWYAMPPMAVVPKLEKRRRQ